MLRKSGALSLDNILICHKTRPPLPRITAGGNLTPILLRRQLHAVANSLLPTASESNPDGKIKDPVWDRRETHFTLD